MNQLNLALLLLRLGFGLMMVTHGSNKVRGGMQGTARWFASMGLKPGMLHAVLAASTEISTGFGFAAGFLTPLTAAGIISIMLVAIVVDHINNGFFVFRKGEGWEYCALVALTVFCVATIGPGRYSLDHAFGINWHGWTGALIAGLVGVLSAAALLAVYWRPDPKQPEPTNT